MCIAAAETRALPESGFRKGREGGGTEENMRTETKQSLEAFARAAIADPVERDAALRAIAAPDERKDRALKTREACLLAGVSPRTLQIWTRAGKLHPKRPTRSHVRYSRNELERFLGYQLED